MQKGNFICSKIIKFFILGNFFYDLSIRKSAVILPKNSGYKIPKNADDNKPSANREKRFFPLAEA